MTTGLRQADKSLVQKPDLFTLFTLLIGYRQHLRVVGNSMEVTLSEGDLVIYKKINTKFSVLETGDIVIASHPRKKSKLILKGFMKFMKTKLI